MGSSTAVQQSTTWKCRGGWKLYHPGTSVWSSIYSSVSFCDWRFPGFSTTLLHCLSSQGESPCLTDVPLLKVCSFLQQDLPQPYIILHFQRLESEKKKTNGLYNVHHLFFLAIIFAGGRIGSDGCLAKRNLKKSESFTCLVQWGYCLFLWKYYSQYWAGRICICLDEAVLAIIHSLCQVPTLKRTFKGLAAGSNPSTTCTGVVSANDSTICTNR